MAKILLVEDSEQIWDFLTRRLQRRGHDVVVAKDGEEGLMTARSIAPEVVLLDMNLPVMDGWSVARALKSQDQTRAIPIIALTAHAMAGDREKAIQAGCDDYHPKPIDFNRLIEQIQAQLERGHAASATAG